VGKWKKGRLVGCGREGIKKEREETPEKMNPNLDVFAEFGLEVILEPFLCGIMLHFHHFEERGDLLKRLGGREIDAGILVPKFTVMLHAFARMLDFLNAQGGRAAFKEMP